MAWADGADGTAAAERAPRVAVPGFAGNSDIFFAAVALTQMPMLVTDPNLPDNPIAYANQACCQLTGYPPAALVGRNCRILQGPGTDRKAIARIRDALCNRTDIAVEVLNYRRDGTPFWNAVFISPVFAPDGRLLYFFASQLDVTRRRAAERALAETQRLEGLGALAGGVAHAFNNLLTVIRGNIEPLLRESADARTRARLDRVRNAADRAAALTRAMVSFARRQRLEDEAFDLVALLRGLRPVLVETLGPQRQLAFDLPEGPAPVRADRAQLRTALLNIVLNAREATGEGGAVRIGVAVEPMPARRTHRVVVAVSDHGVGMPPEVAARAVEPFFTTKPPGAGTGLGLSMAYGFMQQSGGYLELASNPGSGTTVRLVFPAGDWAGDGAPAAR